MPVTALKPLRLRGANLARCSARSVPGADAQRRKLEKTCRFVACAAGPEDLASGAADASGAAAETVAKVGGSGPFDGLAHLFEGALTNIDHGLVSVGVPYSYGFAIIVLTLLVKAATFPLTAKQVKSTLSMQALQPKVKEIQSKYANEPERLNMETQRLYKENQVNPLAGCLPTLATIPVFIGLYRALQLAASDGLLNEGFFWVPSLGGPTTTAQQAANQGMSWLFPFQNGEPPLGWETTARYLVLPVLLVISQYVSLQISQPKGPQDPSMKTTQQILKFIPFMIGWFSLNVPSGLTIYWLTNNVITTAQQVYLKNTTKVDTPATATAGADTGNSSSIIGQREASSQTNGSGASASETNSARRSKKGEKFAARQAAAKAPDEERVQSNSRGKKKGEKFAKRKAGAGSSNGTGQSESNGASNGAQEAATAPVATSEKSSE